MAAGTNCTSPHPHGENLARLGFEPESDLMRRGAV
jgi:hypothetical protein